jgi:hypothetical protein
LPPAAANAPAVFFFEVRDGIDPCDRWGALVVQVGGWNADHREPLDRLETQ